MLASLDQPVMIVLDGEPRGKGRPRFSRKSGVAFTPPETRKYETDLAWAGRAAMRARNPLDGPISVSIVAYMPIPSSWPKWKQAAARARELRATGKPDVDNIMKMLDSINGIVFKDDSQITQAIIRKEYSDKPSLHIEITPMKQAER